MSNVGVESRALLDFKPMACYKVVNNQNLPANFISCGPDLFRLWKQLEFEARFCLAQIIYLSSKRHQGTTAAPSHHAKFYPALANPAGRVARNGSPTERAVCASYLLWAFGEHD